VTGARTGRGLVLLLTLGIGALAGAPARAGQTCTVSGNDLAFGLYDPQAGGALESTGSVDVTCTSVGDKRVTYDIHLDTGQSGSFNTRALTNGISQLNYNLYTNAPRSQIWGDGSAGTKVVSARFNLTPVGSTQTDSYTVYGRVFAGQNVSTGSYLDTITVTVFF
jgi:spore coat protein U-like protein